MRELSKTKLILKIYNRLHMRPVTIKSLKSWLESNDVKCSSRTIYRHLDDLSDSVSLLGEKIEMTFGHNGTKIWKLIHFIPGETLDERDINSLYMFFCFAPDAIKSHRKMSFDKLEKILHSQISKNNLGANINATQNHIHNTNFQQCDYSHASQAMLDSLIRSIEKNAQVVIREFL